MQLAGVLSCGNAFEVTDLTTLTDTERKGEYDAELRCIGEEACAANLPLYHELVGEVTVHYKAQPRGFRRCIEEVHRRAALRDGFPVFEEWLATRIA